MSRIELKRAVIEKNFTRYGSRDCNNLEYIAELIVADKEDIELLEAAYEEALEDRETFLVTDKRQDYFYNRCLEDYCNKDKVIYRAYLSTTSPKRPTVYDEEGNKVTSIAQALSSPVYVRATISIYPEPHTIKAELETIQITSYAHRVYKYRKGEA